MTLDLIDRQIRTTRYSIRRLAECYHEYRETLAQPWETRNWYHHRSAARSLRDYQRSMGLSEAAGSTLVPLATLDERIAVADQQIERIRAAERAAEAAAAKALDEAFGPKYVERKDTLFAS